MELLQPGLVNKKQLEQINSYKDANRNVITRRRAALAMIFAQENLSAQGSPTGIGTTHANLSGIVRSDEIQLVDSSRGCRKLDKNGNFVPNMDILRPLGIGDIPKVCAEQCRWGINGEGGHDTGCPRLETSIPVFVAYDEMFRPEPIIQEFSQIKPSSFNWIKGQILKTKNDQAAYDLLALECKDTGLPWYRYIFGIQHMGAYLGLATHIYQAESEIYLDKRIKRTGNLLDFACGEGTLTRRLARLPSDLSIEGVKQPLFQNVIGLDMNAAMLNAARKHHSVSNLKYLQGNTEDTNINPDMKFDAIVMNGISRYLSMQETANLIAFCRDILVKNGRVYMSFTQRTEAGVASSKYMTEISQKFPEGFNTSMQISSHILRNSKNASNNIELAGSFGLKMNKFQQLANFELDYREYPTLDPNNHCMCFVKTD
jgi:2-polyprenyl-3-methyl-5-hydroxy-6-metoxy-1,4-benzoquinol methylase